MRRTANENMGRFSVTVKVANNRDVQLANAGVLPQDKVRRVTLSAIVDSGAAHLVLPETVVRQLGLPSAGKSWVRYADQRRKKRAVVEEARVEVLGRQGTYRATVEPARETALLGAIVLEDLDFLVDCTTQSLRPRDPNYIVTEIE
ncbi:MAG: retroviral-like aspartic protease family protein [Planctomycetota bacterium]